MGYKQGVPNVTLSQPYVIFLTASFPGTCDSFIKGSKLSGNGNTPSRAGFPIGPIHGYKQLENLAAANSGAALPE